MELDSIVNNYIKQNPEIITPLAKIVIGKRVNSGGTAIVHEATIEISSEKFVIKLLLENIKEKESSAYKRFKQAYINLQTVQDSNIFLPQIYFHTLQLSEDIIIPFTIMPYAEDTLASYVKNKNIDFELWLNIFNELGQKIEIMHKLNIIHRDLKPQNLFILKHKLVIGDCDIASFDKDKYTKLVETKPSDRLGNYSFSAPEQANKNIDEITPAADWYAFGQIMYWLVHDTTVRGFQKVDLKFDKPIYNQIIEKLLAQDPSARFQSFEEIMNYVSMKQKIQEKQKKIDEQYYNAIRTTELFDEIIFKYTFEESASIPFIKSISRKDEVDDIISFLRCNCDKLNLWISQGNSDININQIIIDSQKETYCFEWHEMKIEKLVLFRLGVYPGGSVIIIITKPLESLSGSTYEDEEICYYKDRIISRPEYDNGWAMIDGQRTELNNDDCDIKIRTLCKTVYFISPQNGLFQENAKIFEEIHNDFLKDNSLDEEHFFEKLKNAKRTSIVKMYD